MKHETWGGCYDTGWGDLITPESFAHPAKAARGLVYKIVREGLARGWFHKDQVIIDPFGGIGTTGIACSAHGLRAVLVELEERFVNLAKENRELHRREWEIMGCPIFEIIQGDSRRLREIVAGAGGAVTSPPYVDAIHAGQGGTGDTGRAGNRVDWRSVDTSYGTTPGQLGAMKEGSLGAVTSPPYGNSLTDETPEQNARKQERIAKSKSLYDGRKLEKPSAGKSGMGGGYGSITSPPYERTGTADHVGQTDALKGGKFRGGGQAFLDAEYGDNPGNLGNQQGETYWGAVRIIYQQLFDLFSPGGHAAIIVKSFVRTKKIVPLPQMTLDLLVDIGFEPVAWIDAKLTGATQASMMDEVPDYTKKRVSFFRRLAEKNGSPKIDEEVVLVVKHPGTGGNVGSITSPPYSDQTVTRERKSGDTAVMREKGIMINYGTSPGQLGAMKEGVP